MLSGFFKMAKQNFLLYIYAIINYASVLQAQSECGDQVMSFHSCAKDVFDQHHPQFFEKREEIFDKVATCFENAGCDDPMKMMMEKKKQDMMERIKTQMYMDEGLIMSDEPISRKKRSPENLFKIETRECFVDTVIHQIVLPQLEQCMQEKFMWPNFKLPDLATTFVPGPLRWPKMALNKMDDSDMPMPIIEDGTALGNDTIVEVQPEPEVSEGEAPSRRKKREMKSGMDDDMMKDKKR